MVSAIITSIWSSLLQQILNPFEERYCLKWQVQNGPKYVHPSHLLFLYHQKYLHVIAVLSLQPACMCTFCYNFHIYPGHNQISIGI